MYVIPTPNDTKLNFISYRNDLCLFLWSCTFRPGWSIFVPWWNLVEWIVNHVLAWIIEPVFPISIDFPGMSKTMWTFFSRLRTSYLLIKAGFYDSLQCRSGQKLLVNPFGEQNQKCYLRFDIAGY